ncbi:hypothetical protein FACS1894142_6460 [Spirochaetia bacterium]|nr:hypothetical protein FACS1894142_6460 [Spirochaetia bacterium]
MEFTLDYGVIGNQGLADPQAAVTSGDIKIGYRAGGGSVNTTTPDNTWNDLVFIPIVKAELVASNGGAVLLGNPSGVGFNRPDKLVIYLDPSYVKDYGSYNKYLFVTPTYKDKGDYNVVAADAAASVQHLGDYTHYQVTIDGKKYWRAYSLGTGF